MNFLKKKFDGIIFDFDDTLVNTSTQVTLPALKQAIQVMIAFGLHTKLEAALSLRSEKFLRLNKTDFLKELVNVFEVRGNKEATVEEGIKCYYSHINEAQIKCDKLTIATLSELASQYDLYLVTLGNPERQLEKIKKSGTGAFFNRITIVDPAKVNNKFAAFRSILVSSDYQPSRLLSVGNRLDIDIKDSKSLGLKTCWIRQGEYSHDIPINELEKPDYTIVSLQEIKGICTLSREKN